MPALLKLINPPGERAGGLCLAGAGRRFLETTGSDRCRHACWSALAGAPLLYYLQFDFNPMNLRIPKAESVATYLDLRKDPNTGANAINVLTRSEEEARVEAKLGEVPEVCA